MSKSKIKCSKCGEVKSVGEFYTHSKVCKQCKKLIQHERYLKNKDIILKRTHEYYLKNKDEILQREKEKYHTKTAEDIKAKRRRSYHTSEQENVVKKVLNRTRKILSEVNYNNIWDVIGCDKESLLARLRVTATVNGYSGNIHRLECDHIIPLYSAKNEIELIKLCHYTNLQMLSKTDHAKKHNKNVGHKSIFELVFNDKIIK
jgi:hypothetical protein